LDKKVTKNQVSRKASFRTGLCAANQAESRAVNFGSTIRSLSPHASAKLYYALSDTQAILILPDFARSCSADGGSFTMLIL
ncbi:MAG TPA: hypothetical protein VGM63_22545, partial [Mucilaginibacter sp.]